MSSSSAAGAASALPAREEFFDRLTAGDAATLARCITLLESGGPAAEHLRRRIAPLTGKAAVIGFTGAPGAGKSTLINVYIDALRAQARSVAVLAVDPSSPITQGAILGDRVRMLQHSEDPGVFIRSVAARGHLGGLSENAHQIVDAMDASGRDVIIIETVGTGQSEIEVAELADICVVVNAPNMGDDIQAMKAGVLEIADILVVNKADLPLAHRTTTQLRAMLKLRQDNRDVAIIETTASKATGVDLLAAAIAERLAARPGDRQTRRERRMRRLIARCAGRAAQTRILDSTDADLQCLFKAASAGEIDIGEAAAQALKIV